jgi:hypothetical protein
MSRYADSAERFAADTKDHKLTVLHEDGLYRHLRFQKPGTGMYWFDLITWPGCLAINGDMEGYVFSRVPDMFEFFRAASGWNGNTINPQYWAEKLRASSRVEEYSEDKLRQLVRETVNDSAYYYPGLRTAVKRRVLNDEVDLSDAESAREVLGEFVHGGPPAPGERDTRFRFENVWEWDMTDWSYPYLWCCHAIQWGIGQYDAARQLAGVAVLSGGAR